MSFNKPSRNEDEFMLRQDALLRHEAALVRARELAAEERERRRREHYMKCPRCGMDLEEVVYRGVPIDKCYHCGGTWLDAGALQVLAGKGGDVLSHIVEIFATGPGPMMSEPF